jgi:predicted RNase H-like nuclease (RuvC/YqgF family)
LRSVIIGLDPGITVGVAILDTKGNILNLTSIREAKRSDLIKHIMSFGKPIIIASDVNPLPKMIERLASALGSKVYYPEVSLTNVEKEKIINDFEKEIKDSHQKDALAAGLKAFRNYHNLFLKVEETLIKQNKKRIFEEVVRELLKDETQNIVDVIKKVSKREKK